MTRKERKLSFQDLNATRVIATFIGVFFGLFSGVNHGIFEILQGNKATEGLLISAIGPVQRFWSEGHEPAFTIVPNFMITGILSVIVGLAIVVWSIRFLPARPGRTVFLGLFILSFLVGGGIGQLFFFLPAWAFATRIGKPLKGWRKVLPPGIRPFLSRLWPVILALATLAMLITLEIAIFGFVPGISEPMAVQNASMIFFFSAIVLYILAFVAGFGHELLRMERNES